MNAIRRATAADAAAIADIYNHYIRNTTITFEVECVDASEMRGRIDRITRNHSWLVFEANDVIRGYAYAGPYHPREAYRHTLEVSIYLKHTETRRGIGTQLFGRLLADLQDAGIHALIGGIALPNPDSVRLHEKFGFEKVAHFREVGFKFGQWIDVGHWEKILSNTERQH